MNKVQSRNGSKDAATLKRSDECSWNTGINLSCFKIMGKTYLTMGEPRLQILLLLDNMPATL